MDKVGVSKGCRGGETLLCFRESNYSPMSADSKMHGFSSEFLSTSLIKRNTD